MHHNQLQGRLGEELAASYLIEKGYQIVGRNVRAGRSEFDLIATYQAYLIFVEVKTRKDAYFGQPESFVGASKENAMVRGAQHYIENIGYEGEIRFDIISITLQPQIEIEHFEDAFWSRS
jgi:putative endonuclease